MIEKYLHKDEKILVEVIVRTGSIALSWSWVDYFYYATNKPLLCLRYELYYQEPELKQLFELPYSNVTVTLEKKRKILLLFVGLLLLGMGLSFDPISEQQVAITNLLKVLGLALIAAMFLWKDSWYQIDSPMMTDNNRWIWQIPVDAKNADKFYAVVSEKAGRVS